MKKNEHLKGIFLMTLVLASLVSCREDPYKDSNVKIEGQFPHFAGKKMTLNEIEVYAYSPIDTFQIDRDGLLKGGISIEETGIYVLKADNRNFINLVLSPGEQVKIISEGSEINANYQLSGSEDSEMLLKFEKQYEAKRKIIDSVTLEQSGTGRPQQGRHFGAIKELFDSLREEHKRFVTKNIRSHPASISNLVMVNRRFGQYKVFNEYDDFEILSFLDSALMDKYPGNKHIIEHHNRMEQAYMRIQAQEHAKERLAPGKPAPENIILPDPGGNELNLSDIRADFLLLHFWASADATSRKVNPELVEFNKNYRNKGLRIVSISLDVYKEMWEGAIKLDKLEWTHLSDLQGRHSPVVFLFQVPDSLPYFYLLDREKDIIVATGKLDVVKDYAKRLINQN